MAAVLNVQQIPPQKIKEIMQSPDFMKELAELESKCERPIVNEILKDVISVCVNFKSFKELAMPLQEWKQVITKDYDKLDLLTIQKVCEIIMSHSFLQSGLEISHVVDIIENTVHLFNDCAKILNELQEKVLIKLYNRSLLTIK